MMNLLFDTVVEYVKDNHPRWRVHDNYSSTILPMNLDDSPLNVLCVYGISRRVQACFMTSYYVEEEYTDDTILEQISKHMIEGETILSNVCGTTKI